MNVKSVSNFPPNVISLLAALLTTVALAGCGSEPPPSKTGSDKSQPVSTASRSDSLGQGNPAGFARKPCEYMQRADAEAAVGQALPNTTEHTALGMCDYNTPDFYGASLTVGDWEGIKGAATSGGPQRPPTTVSGVGDEALNLNGSGGSNLYVRKGGRGFLLILNGPNIDGLPDRGLEREKTLALKILQNL
jgi:predicted small lipoprotein YifL